MIVVPAKLREVVRICGKWTVGIAFVTAWSAIVGTFQSVDALKTQTYIQQRWAKSDPEFVELFRRNTRERIEGTVGSAVVSAVAIVIARRRWVHERRAATNHCVTCAYDLTGNTSGVCPECGTALTGKAGA